MLDAETVFGVGDAASVLRAVAGVKCEIDRGVGAERAEFGFRTAVDAQLEAGALVIGVVLVNDAVNDEVFLV
jgi:hypothetical protein